MLQTRALHRAFFHIKQRSIVNISALKMMNAWERVVSQLYYKFAANNSVDAIAA